MDEDTTHEEEPTPPTKNDNALFMPPGSVRAILAIGLVSSLIYASLTDPTNVPSGLMTLTTAATAFYFGAKKLG